MFNLFKSKKKMKYATISAEELKKLQQENADAVVVDVRTPAEVRQGKIPGSTSIDIMDRNFANRIETLDKDKTYLVYCRSGNRSGQACSYMADRGFTKLYNLNGGIGSWPYALDEK